MAYRLRLFEGDTEVSSSTVAYVPGADNYPWVGQTINDTWVVLEVVSHTETERCLRVKRIKEGRRQISQTMSKRMLNN
jgi:hypothetical protein